MNGEQFSGMKLNNVQHKYMLSKINIFFIIKLRIYWLTYVVAISKNSPFKGNKQNGFSNNDNKQGGICNGNKINSQCCNKQNYFSNANKMVFLMVISKIDSVMVIIKIVNGLFNGKKQNCQYCGNK